jgi:hypothetical protein
MVIAINMNATKIPYLLIFIVTLLIAWVFLGWFGDYNMYVGDVYKDGRAWVKERGTMADRVALSLILALIFAAIETAFLWIWQVWRTKK